MKQPLHLTIIGILLIAALTFAFTLTIHMMFDPRYCPPGYELQERWFAEPGELYAEAVCTTRS